MSRNGAGIFAVINPILIGAVRSSADVNQDFSDAGTEITNTVAADGQTLLTGPAKVYFGSLQVPGLSFASDRNVGFYLSAPDEMRWCGGNTDRFYCDSALKSWVLGAMDVTGTVTVNGTLTGSASDLPAIENLTGTGIARRTATNTWALDDGTHNIPFTFQAGGAIVPTNMAIDIRVPYACTITANTLTASVATSAVIAITKVAYASYPGSLASIVASAPPTLSTATSSTDTTLTGWTTSVAAGDCIRVSVTSNTAALFLELNLTVKRYI